MAIFIISIAILAIILGVIVLIFPKMLNRIIAIWLIAYGILQLLDNISIGSILSLK